MTECVLKKLPRKADIYNMFHIDATASVDQFTRKHTLSRSNAIRLLTAGLSVGDWKSPSGALIYSGFRWMMLDIRKVTLF